MNQVSRHHSHLDHPYHSNCSFLPKSVLDNDILNTMDQAYSTISNELDHVKCFFYVRDLFFKICSSLG